jgi:ABC-type nitrate/sulfonate/bicarbonate transport system substrate-binding protein
LSRNRPSLVDKSPDLAERVLRAMVESILYINNPANKAGVMRTLAKDLRLAKVEDAESGYEQMKSLYDRKIYPNIDGLKNVVRLLAGSSEQLRKLKVESIVDGRIVRKLEKEGLF